jgi:anti-anti-sigma factor
MTLKITRGDDDVLQLEGRFDAAQATQAKDVLWKLNKPTRIDMTNLEYISSAGIGIIVQATRRLREQGHELTFFGVNPSVRNVLRLTGLLQLLKIE